MAKVELTLVAVTAKFGRVTMPKVFTEVEESITWTAEYADGAKAECKATYAEQLSTIPRRKAQRAGAGDRMPRLPTTVSQSLKKVSQGKPHFPKVNHQASQLDGMALELLSGRPSIAPGEMGRRDVAIIEAIYLPPRRAASASKSAPPEPQADGRSPVRPRPRLVRRSRGT